MVEESERPDGPFIAAYTHVTEERNFNLGALRQTLGSKVVTQREFFSTTVVNGTAAKREFGSRSFPGTPGQIQEARGELYLGPERVLLTALRANPRRMTQSDNSESIKGSVA
jgi:hypothetical protein